MLRLAGDDRLVALLRDGHEAAFEAIYDRHHRPLLSFCRHMLGNPEEAADAVQQTFLSAYRALEASDKPIALRAWLFTIARNRCLSLLRARRETVALEDVEPATEGLAREVEQRQDLREMLADIARLPDDQRAALVLAELGALGHKEIAEVLGCRRDKVKALVFQARSSLSASRTARDTPCHEIREQLATLEGGSLRRTTLRRHVRDCPGCREFGAEVKRQRGTMAVLLPVVPAVGLRQAVLSSAGAGGGAAAATAGGGGLAGLLSGVAGNAAALKALATIGIVGVGAIGSATIAINTGVGANGLARETAAAGRTGTLHAQSGGGVTAVAGAIVLRAETTAKSAVTAKALAAHGWRPAGNSAAGHAIALSSGQGHKRGLLGTQPTPGPGPLQGDGRSHAGSGHANGPPAVTPAQPQGSPAGPKSRSSGPSVPR